MHGTPRKHSPALWLVGSLNVLMALSGLAGLAILAFSDRVPADVRPGDATLIGSTCLMLAFIAMNVVMLCRVRHTHYIMLALAVPIYGLPLVNAIGTLSDMPRDMVSQGVHLGSFGVVLRGVLMLTLNGWAVLSASTRAIMSRSSGAAISHGSRSLPSRDAFPDGTRFVIKEFDVPLAQIPGQGWINWYGGHSRPYDVTSLVPGNHWDAGSFDEWREVVRKSSETSKA